MIFTITISHLNGNMLFKASHNALEQPIKFIFHEPVLGEGYFLDGYELRPIIRQLREEDEVKFFWENPDAEKEPSNLFDAPLE